jgi:hypothetical protein
LADAVDQLMHKQGLKLSVIETRTQGAIAQLCSEKWLDQSLVYPCVEDAFAALKLSPVEVNEVSLEQCVERYCERQNIGVVLVQVCVELPDGSTTFYSSISGLGATQSAVITLQGRLARKQALATHAALNLLRKHLVSS